MDCLSFPIKFTDTGLKRVEEGTFDFYKQILTISLLTEPGQHPITPEFGVLDPSFTPIEPEDFIINAARFVPEIDITGINPSFTSDGGLSVEFSFKLRG